MSFLRRNTSLRIPATKQLFSSTSARQKKIPPPAQTKDQPGSVDASLATVMVHMQKVPKKEKKDIVTSLKEHVIAGEILKASSSAFSAFRRDKIHDIARGVADKFVNMEEDFQARKRSLNPHNVSSDFKPLPFQTVHPSALHFSQAAENAVPTPTSNFKPLPFQTVHPTVSHIAEESNAGHARGPVQSDWLADSDDVSGAAQASSKAPAFASLTEDVSNSRVTGDVPHLDLAEAMEDTSVDELGSGEQKNRDYTASNLTFSSHVNHRNKSIDRDNGYGVIPAAEQEEQTATEIPSVNSTAPILLEPAASLGPGGTMEDLACVDNPIVMNENLQPSQGYAAGEHQIALGQAALRARFTQGEGPEVTVNPGADASIQLSRKRIRGI